MADFNRDMEETRSHPEVLRFLEQCGEQTGGGNLTVVMLQTPPLIRFSDRLIILEWDPARHDFYYRYWGSQLTSIYGLELTGKYIADGEHRDTENPFIEAHLEVIREGRPVYLGGTIDWRDKEFQRWNQVSLPLERNGRVNETVTFVTFD